MNPIDDEFMDQVICKALAQPDAQAACSLLVNRISTELLHCGTVKGTDFAMSKHAVLSLAKVIFFFSERLKHPDMFHECLLCLKETVDQTLDKTQPNKGRMTMEKLDAVLKDYET